MKSAPSGTAEVPPKTLQSPIRHSALEELRMLAKDGSPHLVCRVVTLYLSHSPENLKAMKEAVASGNYVTAGRAAHSLISSSAVVGAMGLSALCAEMEKCCSSGGGEDTSALCCRIQEEHGAVLEALSTELRRLTS